MEIAESKRHGVVVLGVAGRIDAANAGLFEEKLLGLIAAGEGRFVVDCDRLDYISSAGLRILLVAAKRLAPSGGQIALSAPQALIKEILDIAGFSSIFRIYRTHEDAVVALLS
ncbi:MAG: STAS domain-containing protein [Candidatus Binatia bacterium]